MATGNKLIGEKELFHWASKITKIKITELKHLRDGIVTLKLFESIWLHIVHVKELNIIEKCTNRNDCLHNWKIIEQIMVTLILSIFVFE